MTTNYNTLDFDNAHVKQIINWLFIEVLSAGGDGDGIWYSKFYNIKDIKKFIEHNNILPKFWVILRETEDELTYYCEQENLTITNNKDRFNNRPEWQQVSLVY